MNISIIIPTKNRAKLLERCLNLLTNQTTKRDEIYVVDNMSSDNTKMVVNKFGRKFPVHYLHNKVGGASGSRNFAFRHIKNEGVAFIDDDSLINKNWVKNVKSTLEKFKRKNPDSVFQGEINQKYEKPGYLEHKRMEYFSAMKKRDGMQTLLNKPCRIRSLIVCNIFTYKRVLQKIQGPYNEKTFPFMGEDQDLACRLIENDIKILYVPDVKIMHYKPQIKPTRLIKGSFAYGRATAIIEKVFATNYEFLLKYNAIRLNKIKTTKNKKREQVKQNIISDTVYYLLTNLSYWSGYYIYRLVFQKKMYGIN